MSKITEKELDAIKKAMTLIENKTVYRFSALCDDGSAFVTSTNGMKTTRFTKKQILDLAKIVKTKPEGI